MRVFAFALTVLSLAGAAQAQVATLAYVPNSESSTLSVIDTRTARLVEILPYAGKSADSIQGLVYSRNGDVLHLFDGIGSLVGTVRMRHGSPYPAATEPRNVSLAPDARHLAICDGDAGEVVFVDTATLYEAWTIPLTGGVAQECAYSPDGKWLLVVQPEAGRISVLDVAARRSVASLKPSAAPRGVGFSPDGKTLYLVTDDSSRIEVVDTAAWKIVGGISADGEKSPIRQARGKK